MAFEKLADGKARSGLLAFFGNKASAEEKRTQVARATEETQAFLEREKDLDQQIVTQDDQRRKERQNERQRRHRAKVKAESHAAAASSGAHPRRVKRTIDDLRDSAETVDAKRQKQELAESSRPKREIMTAYHSATRKAQGRKRVRSPHRAAYVNWHTKALWDQIDAASKHPAVGPQMSTHFILKVLMQRNPLTFKALS